MTGLSAFSEALNTKRLEVLREIAPDAWRVGVFFGAAVRPPLELTLKTGTALPLDRQPIEVSTLDDLDALVRTPRLGQFDAFLVATDGFFDPVPDRVVAPLNRPRRPATLPFERPERFDLTLNQRTAGEAGIVFPPLLLAQAREILE